MQVGWRIAAGNSLTLINFRSLEKQARSYFVLGCVFQALILHVSSMTSWSEMPGGSLPSANSFSIFATSVRLWVFRRRASNLAFSLSLSLTRGCLAVPFARGAV